MPVPNSTFTGNARFACPRSYWQKIAIGYGLPADISLTGNVVHVHQVGGFGFIDTFVTLDHRFVTWSSNRWTLDHIFIDQVSYFNGSPTPLYFHCNLGYGIDPSDTAWCATLAYDGSAGYLFQPLEPAPPTYWNIF